MQEFLTTRKYTKIHKKTKIYKIYKNIPKIYEYTKIQENTTRIQRTHIKIHKNTPKQDTTQKIQQIQKYKQFLLLFFTSCV